jgi:hypothetical protein
MTTATDTTTTFNPTLIPNTRYALANNGYVYNMRTKNRLKRQWVGNGWRTNCTRLDGTSFWFRHSDLNSATRSEALKASLSREDTLPVTGWPKYATTRYGAIWCVKPGTRGRGAGGPFLVSEFLHRGNPHVNLSDKYGKRRCVSVKKLVQATWGEEACVS